MNIAPDAVASTTGLLIGYARTSTEDQVAGLEAQERELRAVGAAKIFSERVSSVAEREQLKVCLQYLRGGDCLVVTKLDRLARSTAEFLTIQADLAKREIGLVILSVGGERLDTRNATSRLMLTVLAGVAEWERQMMLERQQAGIAKAKADGRYKGRAPTVRRQGDEIRALVAAGGKPAQVARKLGVSRSSVYRMLEGADAV